MNTQLCHTKSNWKEDLGEKSQESFLQSWDWGEFQEKTGKKVLRLQVVDNSSVVYQIQVYIHQLALGKYYAYIPRCVIADASIFRKITDFLANYGVVFVRIEPISSFEANSPHRIEVTKNRQPSDTILLDISEDEEEVLAQMHGKTRYNIRLAQKRGVQIKEEEDSDIFWELHRQTSKRDGFCGHDKSYYEHMIASPFARQLVAYKNNTPLASNIYILHNGVCTYLHGASGNAHRNDMAPHLLQWKGVELAKKHQCHVYDFWGVAPEPKHKNEEKALHSHAWNVNHSLSGVTRFKAGFGGRRVTYGRSHDVILSSFWYNMYRLAKKIRRII